jgi:hypothetical protein
MFANPPLQLDGLDSFNFSTAALPKNFNSCHCRKIGVLSKSGEK